MINFRWLNRLGLRSAQGIAVCLLAGFGGGRVRLLPRGQSRTGHGDAPADHGARTLDLYRMLVVTPLVSATTA